MSLILQLETSDSVCAVALADKGNLIAVKEDHTGFTHAENLAIFVEQVIKENGYKPTDSHK